jgi:hypothetical protein
MQDTMISVYDFGVLPFALGDVLTWCVRQGIRARQANKKIELYACVDQESPANYHQRINLNPTNATLHWLELQPAFYCQPSIKCIRVFHNRSEMLHLLDVARHCGQWDATEDQAYRKALASAGSCPEANDYVRMQVSSHRDINLDATRCGGALPYLHAPLGADKDVREFIRQFREEGCFIVALHFRLRGLDRAFEGSELHRDAEFEEWMRFMRVVSQKFPFVRFVLLGRIQEKPIVLLKQKNVIVPRFLGFNLAHELALVQEADLFMGTSSGFAAMANFTQVPYAIFRMTEGAYQNYEVEPGSRHLPFANNDQELYNGDETFDLLFGVLVKHIKQSRSSGKLLGTGPKAILSSQINPDESPYPKAHESVSTYRYVIDAATEAREIGAFVYRSIVKASRFINENRIEEAFNVLKLTRTEFGETVERVKMWNYTLAVIHARLGDWAMALKCVGNEEAVNPDGCVQNLRATLTMLLQQYQSAKASEELSDSNS